MSYMLNPGAESESNIEVHKYYSGTVLGAALLALVLQAFLHKYGRWSELIDLPLLVTIYFGVSRRNPVTGLFLGAAIGIFQDALSHDPIGLYGIAKTIVGYVASSIGARIDTEHPASRFGLIFLFFHFHQVVLTITQHVLLSTPPAGFDRYGGRRYRSFRAPRSSSPLFVALILPPNTKNANCRPQTSDRVDRMDIGGLRSPSLQCSLKDTSVYVRIGQEAHEGRARPAAQEFCWHAGPLTTRKSPRVAWH